MVFYAAFNNISVISRRQLTLFMPSWVSSVLGWGSEVSCPRTLPRKNTEDPVRLEPRTPASRVKHFTTEPRRTPEKVGRKFWINRAASFTLFSKVWSFKNTRKRNLGRLPAYSSFPLLYFILSHKQTFRLSSANALNMDKSKVFLLIILRLNATWK